MFLFHLSLLQNSGITSFIIIMMGFGWWFNSFCLGKGLFPLHKYWWLVPASLQWWTGFTSPVHVSSACFASVFRHITATAHVLWSSCGEAGTSSIELAVDADTLKKQNEAIHHQVMKLIWSPWVNCTMYYDECLCKIINYIM